jgi:glycosyltransferase involved in cell wall biosynthesis
VKSKKVLVDVHDLYVAQTGIKSYIFELLEVIKQDQTNQYIISPNPTKATQSQFFRKKGIFRSLLFHLYTFCWKQIIIPVVGSLKGVDVLICPDYYAPAVPLPFKKLVVFHDSLFWDQPSNYNAKWLSYFKMMILQGLNGNSRVITVSNTSRQRLEPVIRAKSPIDVIYTSFEGRQHTSSDDNILHKHNIISSRYFLHAGVFEKRKNLVLLVKAFAMFRKRNEDTDFKLVLIGNKSPKRDMDDYENVLDQIKKEEVTEHVVLPGYVSNEDRDTLYSHCFCYLFPSLREGFGLPLLEVMSNSKPVIISNEPALTEIAGDSAISADATDPSDWCQKLELLLRDEQIYSNLQKNGKQRAASFARGKMKNELVRLISE